MSRAEQPPARWVPMKEGAYQPVIMTIKKRLLISNILMIVVPVIAASVAGICCIALLWWKHRSRMLWLILGLMTGSLLVAQTEAAGNHRQSEEILRTSMALFSGIGLLCSGILYLSADVLAHFVIQMEGVQGTLRALSPAVLFVCLSSVLRGYYLGLGSAKTAGGSQVVEQLLKSVLTVLIVLALTGCSAQMMSAGANFATSIAVGGSFAYLIVGHIRYQAGRPRLNRRRPRQSFFKLSKTILRLSVPVSAASIIISVGRVIDTATISRGIAAAFAGGIPGQP